MARRRSNTTKRKVGRPVEPVPADAADEIIECISNGESLRGWCRGAPGRPCFTTVYDWLQKDTTFALRFKQARSIGFDAIADECQIIASERPEDPLELGWKKLQIDTRLRLLAKWDPARYGDRQQVDHGGGMQITLVTGVPDEEG